MFDEKDLLIEARHVTRRFPTNDGRLLTACNDVNLKFYKGKTLGIVGESGCGKSTFMRFLVGLDTPSEGEIWFRGMDITKLKGRAAWGKPPACADGLPGPLHLLQPQDEDPGHRLRAPAEFRTLEALREG